MKKLAFILLVFVAFSCSKGISEKDIVGKYKVTIVMNNAGADPEADAIALAMFASSQIQYDFQKPDILVTSVNMGSMAQSNSQYWKLTGDSIFLDAVNDPDEYFTITKADKGFLLSGGEMNLKLEKID